MQRLKSLRYSVLEGPRFICGLPCRLVFAILGPIALQIWSTAVRHGIRLVNPFQETQADFFDAVDDALSLIETNDRIRFQRLRRVVQMIMNVPVKYGGAYDPGTKMCKIDLRSIDFAPDRAFGVSMLACLIIHESTHGYLYAKKFPHTKRNFPRLESICRKEEIRFARRLGIDVSAAESADVDFSAPSYREHLQYAYQQIKRLARSP